MISEKNSMLYLKWCNIVIAVSGKSKHKQLIHNVSICTAEVRKWCICSCQHYESFYLTCGVFLMKFKFCVTHHLSCFTIFVLKVITSIYDLLLFNKNIYLFYIQNTLTTVCIIIKLLIYNLVYIIILRDHNCSIISVYI